MRPSLLYDGARGVVGALQPVLQPSQDVPRFLFARAKPAPGEKAGLSNG